MEGLDVIINQPEKVAHCNNYHPHEKIGKKLLQDKNLTVT